MIIKHIIIGKSILMIDKLVAYENSCYILCL
jgi:hypothetical protein